MNMYYQYTEYITVIWYLANCSYVSHCGPSPGHGYAVVYTISVDHVINLVARDWPSHLVYFRP